MMPGSMRSLAVRVERSGAARVFQRIAREWRPLRGLGNSDTGISDDDRSYG